MAKNENSIKYGTYNAKSATNDVTRVTELFCLKSNFYENFIFQQSVSISLMKTFYTCVLN